MKTKMCNFQPEITLKSVPGRRQLDGEGAASAQFRRDGDFPTMRTRKVLHDGETKSGATHLSRTRAIDTIKSFK
jgi:hypothetical protein